MENLSVQPNTFERNWWEGALGAQETRERDVEVSTESLLTLCMDAAYDIGDITRQARFRVAELSSEIKPGEGGAPESPVTEYDLASEELLRNRISGYFGDQARVIGEEFGGQLDTQEDAYNIVIDPIDGTKSFLLHENGFSVAISIFKGSEVVASVVANPIQEELYYAYQDEKSRILQLPTRAGQVLQAQDLPSCWDPNPDKFLLNTSLVKIKSDILSAIRKANDERVIYDLRGLGGSPALNIAEA